MRAYSERCLNNSKQVYVKCIKRMFITLSMDTALCTQRILWQFIKTVETVSHEFFISIFKQLIFSLASHGYHSEINERTGIKNSFVRKQFIRKICVILIFKIYEHAKELINISSFICDNFS